MSDEQKQSVPGSDQDATPLDPSDINVSTSSEPSAVNLAQNDSSNVPAEAQPSLDISPEPNDSQTVVSNDASSVPPTKRPENTTFLKIMVVVLLVNSLAILGLTSYDFHHRTNAECDPSYQVTRWKHAIFALSIATCALSIGLALAYFYFENTIVMIIILITMSVSLCIQAVSVIMIGTKTCYPNQPAIHNAILCLTGLSIVLTVSFAVYTYV